MNTSAKIMLKIKVDEAKAQHEVGLITKEEMLALICKAKMQYEK